MMSPEESVAAALEAREMAQNHFDNATSPDLVEAAIYELAAAELRLRAAIRMAKAGKVGL